MALQPPPRATPPSSAIRAQELLGRLIQSGLNASDTTPAATRTLIEVLIQECIIRSGGQSPTPNVREQANFTLSILRREMTARPQMLWETPTESSGAETGAKLYTWLLPRLIYSAILFDRNEEARYVADDICSAAAGILRTLIRDEVERAGVGIKATERAIQAIWNFSQDALSANYSSRLYDYEELVAHPSAALYALDILSQLPLYTLNHYAMPLYRRIFNFEDSSNAFPRYRWMRLLCRALQSGIPIEGLVKPLQSLCVSPLFDDPIWGKGVTEIIHATQHRSQTDREALWWILLAMKSELRVRHGVMFESVAYLLTPIGLTIDTEAINEVIPVALLNLWTQDAVSLPTVAHARFIALVQDLSLPAPELSRKRKHNTMDKLEEIREALLAAFPAERLTGRTIHELFSAAQDSWHNCVDGKATSDRISVLLGLTHIMLDRGTVLAEEQYIENISVLLRFTTAIWSRDPLDEYNLLRTAAAIIGRVSNPEMERLISTMSYRGWLQELTRNLCASNRRNRVLAGRILTRIFMGLSTCSASQIVRKEIFALIKATTDNLPRSPAIRETSILLLGQYGRYVQDVALQRILVALIAQLGTAHGPLCSLAHTEFHGIARFHGKTPYTLLLQFIEPISAFVVSRLTVQPEIMAETMQLIGQTRQNFLRTTLKYTLPALILNKDGKALEMVASICDQPLGRLVLEWASDILSQVFLEPQRTDDSLSFLINLLQRVSPSAKSNLPVSASAILQTCIITVAVNLIVELGDEDSHRSETAMTALINARRYSYDAKSRVTGSEMGDFLKSLMLGVISQMNDMLHDVQGKKTVREKRKIIRSLGALIHKIGDSMSSFSPQIMASLQSTLGIPELREVTLDSWFVFIDTLRYSDTGPFVGRTTAAIVANWSEFTPRERAIATRIVRNIADNAAHLSGYLADIVCMDDIPELAKNAAPLSKSRKNASTQDRLVSLLRRSSSKNVAVATTAMQELRKVLLSQSSDLVTLTRGDSFDPLVAQIIASLMSAVTRDSDCQDLRDLGAECLGILGALDPDRFASSAKSKRQVIMSNFSETDETIEFVLGLIKDLLIDAFRATNDTRHQNHLAFAIQELLRFCGFTQKVLNGNEPNAKIRSNWAKLKEQSETVSPLLEARFTLPEPTVKSYVYPIYSSAPTYREWIQMWTTDLMGKIIGMPLDQFTTDSKRIFGVFRGVLRNQDVTVAHHILPHLVLHVLLSGNAEIRTDVVLEMNSVLQDQVNPIGSADKRLLSAPVIFDLMDHLSMWLQHQQAAEGGRKAGLATVSEVLTNIDSELQANAALMSKAYARSLRNFEQRVIQLRHQQKLQSDLQVYYERLHHIYAELDEPDGMEGVSTFIISPSLAHEIREHEMTGRWTSAQSCWEVRLQQSPDDVNLHLGLLKCLKNLGHYDTLRTHIRGVLSRQPSWSTALAPYEAEAAWIIGDWQTVDRIGKIGPVIGQAMLAVNTNTPLDSVMTALRRKVLTSITSAQYARSYEPILDLAMLRDIELISRTRQTVEAIGTGQNSSVRQIKALQDLSEIMNDRLEVSSPAFRIREALLSMRRTAVQAAQTPALQRQIASAWISSAKIARKAGYTQTAYSAILQAKETEAPFAFVQQAKLNHTNVGVFKALSELSNQLVPVVKAAEVVDLTESSTQQEKFARHRQLSKAVLLEARWAVETDRFERNDVISKFREAIKLGSNLESPHYHLGHYYDELAAQQTDPTSAASFNVQTCHSYIEALKYGNKYIYRTMPRLLTIWLDLGEKEVKKSDPAAGHLSKINKQVDGARKELLPYQFYTAFPQIMSRMGHSNAAVFSVLMKIAAEVIRQYPQHALWATIGLMQSKRSDRQKACKQLLERVVQLNTNLHSMVEAARRLGAMLLRLAVDPPPDRGHTASIRDKYPYVQEVFPSTMILPLQDALTCNLPSTAETRVTHNPFPGELVTIKGVRDKIDVMSSLVKPKKLTFLGSDGKEYPFLCKPHDDLRKDARLMDLNSIINKLLKGESESRRRHLYIRTYAVTTLNEECGLLEWVSNTRALKTILTEGYGRHGKRVYTSDIAKLYEKSGGSSSHVQTFRDKILPTYQPTVFPEWFFLNWPEPSAWLIARMAYSRTLAVMSMIGFVLGLGDRHCENILFDSVTGDTVHVDLNCLFDKGRHFEVPERVPFRLTQNLVDALGVTGVEGVYRRAAEITMTLLRENSESLMSVLEAFVHDPLVEWTKSTSSSKSATKDVRFSADRSLRPIKSKLQGAVYNDLEAIHSVPNQVEIVIKEAMSPHNLGLMYQGWAAWL